MAIQSPDSNTGGLPLHRTDTGPFDSSAGPWFKRPVAAALAVLAWLGFLAGSRALTLPDEARYVAVAWRMLRSGDWLLPELDGLPFFHKPPLFYWITAASIDLVGGVQWASRVASLLGATAGVMAMWYLVRRRVSNRIALWTVLVLVTTPLFFAGAQIATPDMLVDGLIAVTICLFAESTLRRVEGKGTGMPVIAAWAVASLAVLAKGLIGIVIPGLVVFVWLVATRRLLALRMLLSPLGMVVFLVVAAPWFIATELSHPGFARYFFVHHHYERFTGTGFVSARSWWFYLVAIPMFTLPWSPWLVPAAWAATNPRSRDPSPLRSLMWTWLVVVALFFSIPESKPVGYIESVVFPISFLIAEVISWIRPKVLLLAKCTLCLGTALSIGYIVFSGLTYDRDNRLLAKTLAALRKPSDPVAFVNAFYYDVPVYAGLDQPVRVVSNWQDPHLASHDDWRRELVEAATFAPERASSVLVDEATALAPLCRYPLWVLAPTGSERQVRELASATPIFESNGAVLWRISAAICP